MIRPLIVLLALLLGAAPAQAHKIKVFATAEGARISGYVYFNSGNRGQGVHVRVTDPQGTEMWSGDTDAQGEFSFAARQHSDHLIAVTGDDGHAASYVVRADELPTGLPAIAQTAGMTPTAPPPTTPPSPAPQPPPVNGSPAIDQVVEQAVARQIRPLREQLDAYQEKIWWHDVMGGLGTILGIGGLAYGYTARRRDHRP